MNLKQNHVIFKQNTLFPKNYISGTNKCNEVMITVQIGFGEITGNHQSSTAVPVPPAVSQPAFLRGVETTELRFREPVQLDGDASRTVGIGRRSGSAAPDEHRREQGEPGKTRREASSIRGIEVHGCCSGRESG